MDRNYNTLNTNKLEKSTYESGYSELKSLIQTAQSTANGRAKIESGSVIGSYGSSTSFVFSFPCKIVFIVRAGAWFGIYGEGEIIGISPNPPEVAVNSWTSTRLTLTLRMWAGNTIYYVGIG